MSLGYAEKLSYRHDLGGTLGSPELHDDAATVVSKCDLLAKWIDESSRVVAFTGAGISTACGIPDFRGPQGIWTLQRAGKPLPHMSTSFLFATPSLTHQAIVGLHKCGKLSYCCSQNVDGLHLRSGIPREMLAELHGNCFAERCPRCRREYVRDFEMPSVGHKVTGRPCVAEGCRGRLRDHVLDWEDALPEDELLMAQTKAAEADVILCLGTSLQIFPACEIPLKTQEGGGKMVIVNLQKTRYDKDADLVIHAKVDDVMALVFDKLKLPIPSFTRRDALHCYHIVEHKKKRKRVPSASSLHGALTVTEDRGTDTARANGAKTIEKTERCWPSSSGPAPKHGRAGDTPTDNVMPSLDPDTYRDTTRPCTGGAPSGTAVDDRTRNEVQDRPGLQTGIELTLNPAAALVGGQQNPCRDVVDKDQQQPLTCPPVGVASSCAETKAGVSYETTWGFSLHICSAHGLRCPLPAVVSAEVSFPGAAEELPDAEGFRGDQAPFIVSCRDLPGALTEVEAKVTLELVEQLQSGGASVELTYLIKRTADPPGPRPSPLEPDSLAHQTFWLTTQHRHYTEEQGAILEAYR